ncbi:MAG: hypothetical protein N2255_02770 [Kiritimatiellae bacterium]|nr:hypothetical protein [Kiritimatiellia bacterium]
MTTDPPVSITGLTFLRNRLPSAKDIAEGRYASPLFAGPVAPQTWPYLSQTFDCYREWLHDEMPLPAMMLGYTGQRGNTAAEIVECLRKGVRSNYTAPTGTIYLVTNNDIRSTCRAWQYPATVRELASMGIRAFVTSELPTDDRGIIGLMIGAATVEPEGIKSYLPGCMAEHLTSGAAIFDAREQTKVSAWIRAGVTASAGTVTEPLSIWTKFPHARFFVHYAAGCTMIESFYQAVRCPLQLLLVGDPLATPWAPRGKLAVEGMTEEPLHGIVILKAEGETESGQIFSRFVYLLDGRVVGKGRSLKLDTTRFGNGRHRLRVVAHTRGLVRHQAFLEKEILIKNL